MNWIIEPWPWYVTGPLIGMFVPLMLLLGSSFGVSGNLESFCTLMGAGKVADYFKLDLKARMPGLLFVAGAVMGGFIVGNLLTPDYAVAISQEAKNTISSFGITQFGGLQPQELFNWEFLFTTQGMIVLCLGGFLIGFGTRYAGGCTSGHAITGVSSFQTSSIIASVGFFIGGLITSRFILPLIFGS
jgi:uncharacterized membrane protein YedE/YeeE